MGADAFVYPVDAGLSIGGPGFNYHVMLEVHYNNPELQAGTIDSSGIQFFLTKTLRKYDAGVIELGLEYTDKMAIPPQQVCISFKIAAQISGRNFGVTSVGARSGKLWRRSGNPVRPRLEMERLTRSGPDI